MKGERMTRRTDSLPGPHERAILERVGGGNIDPDNSPKVSPRYELAANVRRLNAALAGLPPERVRDLQDDWHASWAELTRQRERAQDEQAEFEAIRAWHEHWGRRLNFSYGGSEGGFTYNGKKGKA
jgi:hypothetical protein